MYARFLGTLVNPPVVDDCAIGDAAGIGERVKFNFLDHILFEKCVALLELW